MVLDVAVEELAQVVIAAVDRFRVLGRPHRSRIGRGLVRPGGRVLGTDFAGRIAIGGSASGLPPGADVFGWCTGALAEQAVASATLITTRPPCLTAEQAAVVSTAGTTALRAVRDAGRVSAGDRVLIIGASGGVGTFAVQISTALGAHVTGVCSTTNCELIRSIGAEHVIDYTLDDPLPPGEAWDVIIDLVRNRPLLDLRRSLTRTGTLVLAADGSSGTWPIPRQIAARVRSAGSPQRVSTLRPRPDRSDLEALGALIDSGAVVPIVSAHYPLAEVPTALSHFAPGHARGTIAITV